MTVVPTGRIRNEVRPFPARRLGLAAILSLAVAAPAVAAEIATLAGPFQPSLQTELLREDEDRRLQRSFTASRVSFLRIADGAGQGRILTVSSTYLVPQAVVPDAMAQLVAMQLEKESEHRDFVRSETREVSGFDFNFVVRDIPGDEEEAEEPDFAEAPHDAFEESLRGSGPRRRVTMVGLISGSMLRVAVQFPREEGMEEQVVDALSRIPIDFAGLLKLRDAFDAESTARVSDLRVATLFGDVTPPKGSSARLTRISDSHTPDGRRLSRTLSFMFAKGGAWLGNQYVALSTSCGTGREVDQAFREWVLGGLVRDKTVQSIEPRVRTRLGGLDATLLSGTRKQNGLRTKLSRWFAHTENAFYLVELESFNARGVLKQLNGALDGLRLDCAPL